MRYILYLACMSNQQPVSFREIIDRWPSFSGLAEDLSAVGYTVGAGVIKQWRRRNSIPSSYFRAIVLASARRGFDAISSDTLIECADSLSPSAVVSPADPAARMSAAASPGCAAVPQPGDIRPIQTEDVLV